VVGGEPLARTEAIKKIWDYIKSNGLQDAENKRAINADDKLRKVFGKPQVTMFELAGIVGKHLPDSLCGEASRVGCAALLRTMDGGRRCPRPCAGPGRARVPRRPPPAALAGPASAALSFGCAAGGGADAASPRAGGRGAE